MHHRAVSLPRGFSYEYVPVPVALLLATRDRELRLTSPEGRQDQNNQKSHGHWSLGFLKLRRHISGFKILLVKNILKLNRIKYLKTRSQVLIWF